MCVFFFSSVMIHSVVDVTWKKNSSVFKRVEAEWKKEREKTDIRESCRRMKKSRLQYHDFVRERELFTFAHLAWKPAAPAVYFRPRAVIYIYMYIYFIVKKIKKQHGGSLSLSLSCLLPVFTRSSRRRLDHATHHFCSLSFLRSLVGSFSFFHKLTQLRIGVVREWQSTFYQPKWSKNSSSEWGKKKEKKKKKELKKDFTGRPHPENTIQPTHAWLLPSTWFNN